MASTTAGIVLERHPHPCPLPARGRETRLRTLGSFVSFVSSPLAGEGQGGGYFLRVEAGQGL